MKRNKFLLVPLMVVILSFVYQNACHGQFGVTASTGLHTFETWDNDLNYFQAPVVEPFSVSFGIGVDYWFRMKGQRIEFFPTINFFRYNDFRISGPFLVDNQTTDYDLATLGFIVNTHIYFMDFFGDCDCPTFSKQGSPIARGLFLRISPGVSMGFHSYRFAQSAQSFEANSEDWAFQISLGLGYDIGISNLLTATPFVQYHVGWGYTSAFVNDYNSFTCPLCLFVPIDDSTNTSWQFGIRFGFRPDYRP